MTPAITGFVTRDQWGARAPRKIGTNITASGRVTAHYGGNNQGMPDASVSHDRCVSLIRAYQRTHMDDRDYHDIAYNMAVCQHGYAFAGRGAGARSAANGTNVGNQNYYAVVFLLGGSEVPTPQAKAAFAWCVAALRAADGVATAEINNHRDHGTGTACAGDHVRAALAAGELEPTTAAAAPPAAAPGALDTDGRWGPATTRRLQAYLGTTVDGVISGQHRSTRNAALAAAEWVQRGGNGSNVIRKMQEHLRARGLYRGPVDGLCGEGTIRALQAHLGTPIDGTISDPSAMVKRMQERLNSNNLFA